MATVPAPPAVRAIDELVARLADAGIEASRDAGAFYPQPVGVLVALPTLVGRGLATRRFTIPVFVVSGDPLNSELAIDRIFSVADDVAYVLSTENYRPSSWRASGTAEPLPAVELTVTVEVTESEV